MKKSYLFGIACACVFSFISIPVNADSKSIKASDYGDIWPFPKDTGGSLYCKELGNGRKAVWLNGTSATYALNGQAMTWVKNAGLIGVDGGPAKMGRDHSTNYDGLNKLIKDGLKLCD